jgi:hypothetical protein
MAMNALAVLLANVVNRADVRMIERDAACASR